MTSRLSYKEIRRLARAWFDEAHVESARDDAEVAAWKKQHRRDSPYYFRDNLGGFDWWFYDGRFFSGGNGNCESGSCDGGGD